MPTHSLEANVETHTIKAKVERAIHYLPFIMFSTH